MSRRGIKLTEDELKRTIDEIVGEAVKPLKEQQTNWIEKIRKEERPLEERKDKGLRAARMIRALAAAKGDPEKAADYVKKNYGDDEIAKALTTTPPGSGGYIVPEEFSTEIVELLRPQSVVRRMGARTIPMTTGVLNIPTLASGSEAYYVTETQNIPTTEPTFGTIRLQWKKLAAIVPISNDLLRYSNPAADVIVRDDLVAAIAQTEDATFIRSSGSGNAYPKGLLYWALPQNVFDAAHPYTLETVTSDLATAVLKLKKNNSRFVNPGWIISPRTEMYLMTVRTGVTGDGAYAFRDEMVTGKLLGYPYAVTTAIPENFVFPGRGLDRLTEVYLADFADVLIGEATRLIVDVSTDAYYNGNSAFTLDQTLIRVITEHDFAVRHRGSVAVIQTVRWGETAPLPQQPTGG